MSLKGKIIGVDFDGTCVTHEYPKIGRDIGAPEVLRRMIADGVRLILWTMRSANRNDGTNPLWDAEKWFIENGIPLFGVNKNPEQHEWTSSPKAYCHIYIDDAALGAPLVKGQNGERDYIDWKKVENMLYLIYSK